MADETRKKCPFCGAAGEIDAYTYVERPQYRVRCRNCGAAIGVYHDTKADAWKRWNHRAGEGQCAGCVWFRIGDAFDWCDLVHQKRDASDFCSKWRKA